MHKLKLRGIDYSQDLISENQPVLSNHVSEIFSIWANNLMILRDRLQGVSCEHSQKS